MSKSNVVAAAATVASSAIVAQTLDANGDAPNQGVELFPTDATMRGNGMASLSARIRHLRSLGAKRGTIVKIVKRENGESPKYQHVRNVLLTPLKRVEPAAPAAATQESTANAA